MSVMEMFQQLTERAPGLEEGGLASDVRADGQKPWRKRLLCVAGEEKTVGLSIDRAPADDLPSNADETRYVQHPTRVGSDETV